MKEGNIKIVREEIQRRLELLRIRHTGYLVDGKPLAPERQSRLEALRAKYRKPKEEAPSHECFTYSFSILMRFEPQVETREEAEEYVYYWMCEHGQEITDLLDEKYRSEGLRGVTLAFE